MKLRTAVLVVAALGVPLALLVAVLPIRWGYGGYIESVGGIVRYVDPAGPAWRAGLREGDEAIMARGYERIVEDAGNVGTTAHIHARRKSGGVRTINVTFVPFSGQLAAQQTAAKLLGAFTALVAFLVAILVILRARDRDAGARAANVLAIAGAGALGTSASLVCGNPWIGTLLYWVLPRVYAGATISAALAFLRVYPPGADRLRFWLTRFAIVPLAWTAIESIAYARDTWLGTSMPVFDVQRVDQITQIFFVTMLLAVIVDAMIGTARQYATPVRWLGSMWVAGALVMAAPDVSALLGYAPLAYSHYKDVVVSGSIFFLAFGVAYPVLRHRLVDLNILVSRATVFTVVSAIIVGMFIGAEWAIGRIFEESFGLSARHGLISQILTLAVVLSLGISARSIHRFVDDRLSNTFFRKRMHALTAIERVAREADSAIDIRAFMKLGIVTVTRGLDPLAAGYYLREGDHYELACSDGVLGLPALFGADDAAPLRLRRWQQPFEIDDDSDERRHMLFLPMCVRGELLGFLCCGPKPDRTPYLPDEVAALSLLADRTGIAYALLSSASSTPLGALSPA